MEICNLIMEPNLSSFLWGMAYALCMKKTVLILYLYAVRMLWP